MEETETARPAVARQEGQALASKAGDEARTLADVTQSQGRELVHQVRSSVRHQADEQSGRVVQSLRDVGQDLSNMADGKGTPTGPVVDATHEIAGRVEKLADRIEERGVEGSLDDLREYGRRRPAQFVLGAFAIGFVAGRLLRHADVGFQNPSSAESPELPSPSTVSNTALSPPTVDAARPEATIGSPPGRGVPS